MQRQSSRGWKWLSFWFHLHLQFNSWQSRLMDIERCQTIRKRHQNQKKKKQDRKKNSFSSAIFQGTYTIQTSYEPDDDNDDGFMCMRGYFHWLHYWFYSIAHTVCRKKKKNCLFFRVMQYTNAWMAMLNCEYSRCVLWKRVRVARRWTNYGYVWKYMPYIHCHSLTEYPFVEWGGGTEATTACEHETIFPAIYFFSSYSLSVALRFAHLSFITWIFIGLPIHYPVKQSFHWLNFDGIK